MTARNFFSKLEIKRIVAAIQEAEKDTSGEIRVHIDNFCKGDAIERATEVAISLYIRIYKKNLRLNYTIQFS